MPGLLPARTAVLSYSVQADPARFVLLVLPHHGTVISAYVIVNRTRPVVSSVGPRAAPPLNARFLQRWCWRNRARMRIRRTLDGEHWRGVGHISQSSSLPPWPPLSSP